MRKTIALLLLWMFTFPLAAYADDIPIYEEGTPITVHVNGSYIATDVQPYIENGRTLIPLRVAAESLGATVEWNQLDKTATIEKNTNRIVFTQNAMAYTLNGVENSLDVPLINKGARLMIPLRALAEALGVEVSWDAQIYDVRINTGAPQVRAPMVPYGTPESARWLVEKYYTQPDPNDPYVGNWYQYLEHNGYTRVERHEYIFISKLNNENYQVVAMFVSHDVGSGQQRIFAFNRDGWKNAGSLRTNFYGSTLYYRGTATGLHGSGYNDFVVEDNKLIFVKTFNELFGVEKRHEVYGAF